MLLLVCLFLGYIGVLFDESFNVIVWDYLFKCILFLVKDNIIVLRIDCLFILIIFCNGYGISLVFFILIIFYIVGVGLFDDEVFLFGV